MCRMYVVELNGYLPLDKDVAEALKYFAPHMSAMELSEQGAVTDNNAWPAPVISTVSNWYHSPVEVDPCKLAVMQQFYE